MLHDVPPGSAYFVDNFDNLDSILNPAISLTTSTVPITETVSNPPLPLPIPSTQTQQLYIHPPLRKQIVWVDNHYEGEKHANFKRFDQFPTVNFNDSSCAEAVLANVGHRIKVNSETNEVHWYCTHTHVWIHNQEAVALIRHEINRTVGIIESYLKDLPNETEEDKENRAKEEKKWRPFVNTYKNANKIDAVLKRIKDYPDVRLPVNNWDGSDMTIQLKEGWKVCLLTGNISRANTQDYMTKVMAIGNLKHTRLPNTLTLWEQSLVDIFRGDQEQIDRLGLAMYYTMTGRKNLKTVVIGVGLSDTAKSFVQNVFKHLLGEYAAPGDFGMFEAKTRRDLDTTYAYDRIRGVRGLFIDESSEDQVLDEARVKAATGGSEVVARASHGTQYTYLPKWTCWMSTNRFPTIRKNDEATWGRLRVFPYDRVFAKGSSERDDELFDKITKSPERLEEIFLWIMSYRERFLAVGLDTETDRMLEAKQRARGDMDYFGDFINDYIIECDQDEGCTVEEMFESYKDWCKETQHKYPLNRTKFKASLRERGIGELGYKVK